MDGDTGRSRRIIVVIYLVKAATAVDIIVTATTFVGLIGEVGVVAAVERVVMGRSKYRIDVGECIVANGRIAICRPGRDINRHCTCRTEIADPGRYLTLRVDTPDDDVIAAPALELIQTSNHTRQTASYGEPTGVEDVRKIAADDALDIDQRVAANASTKRRTGGKGDSDAARRIRIDRAVKA